MLFTIAIPTYNNSATIAAAVESALSQDFPQDYEALVVNNASDDGTLDVVSAYEGDPRLRIISNAETCSLYENHNVCLREANGRYVLFCHADDTLDSNALSVLHRRLVERGFPRRYIVWGHSFYYDYSEQLAKAGFQTGQLFAGARACGVFLEGGLTPSGTCYSKDLLEIGGFLIPQNNRAPSDASTMTLAALRGYRFEMLQEIIFFRYGGSTVLAGRGRDTLLAEHGEAFRDLFSIISRHEIQMLFAQARKRRHPPLVFYNSLSEVLPKAVARELFSYAIRHPHRVRKKALRMTLRNAGKRFLRSSRILGSGG